MKKLILLATITLTGCMGPLIQQNKESSAGVIGCPVEDMKVKIIDVSVLGYRRWEATCYGQTFLCTSQDNKDVRCSKKLTDPNKVVKADQVETEIKSKEECLSRKKFNSLLKCD